MPIKKWLPTKKCLVNTFNLSFNMEPFEDTEPELLVRVLAFVDKVSEDNRGLTRNDHAHNLNLILLQLITKILLICDIVRPWLNAIVYARKQKRDYGIF